MAYNFPDSPTLNQVFQKWTWNGEAWVLTAPVLITNAAGVTFTPTGDIAATNVQAAIVEVDTEMHAADTALQTNINAKVDRAGDTMAGHLSLPTSPAAANAVRKDYVDAAVAAVPVVDISGKVNRVGDTMSGQLTSAPSTAISAAGSAGSFEVRATGTGDAMMSFHRPGAYAVNFGATDNSTYGGWSLGGTNYGFWTTRTSVTSVRILQVALPRGDVLR